ncbi:hypothetical protein A2954_00735 [Candidatus Roizmanbacteria bacterium RIFCSPLOWO2_01_FULL_37_12]|uniref:Uncharacterized protein n=1 Tax=Candidatus Roizmanbacteria bacterium RIFCSPLOWO2_01_FULL_37_12 TaxID=1802056 RepID=A0A1F7IDS8_9BACT|nr:MAG: hypothetical protein A2954_00735 [Candidatus Roizmanbacteria bacterium RIFCSPLOWO2_01_FULL_37_12]
METKIEINKEVENNKRHYYDITLLVDRPDFIEWIVELRKKWKINKLFEDYHEFYSHIWKISNKNWGLFKKDIEKVRQSFGRLPNFDEVIMYALAFNEIPDGIYKSCYLETIEDPADPNNDEKYKYAIIVTPNTIKDDLAVVLKEFKQKVKKGLIQKKSKKVMDEAVVNYEFELGPNYAPPPNKIANIVRDRKWYWLQKKGDSYRQIWEKTERKDKTFDKDGVTKAIKALKKRLT